jgi:hypothetical protein
MRLNQMLGLAAVLAIASTLPAASAEETAVILKKLNAEFTLTKTTADRSDIVTAGAVLVLHKDGVVMYSSATAAPPMNIYKDGHIQRNEFKDKWKVLGSRFKSGNTDTSDISSLAHRTFVSGEKFWLTAIEMQQDGLVLTVYSDPFSDVRYYGQLKFPFPKNSPPPADDILKSVEEVITVAPADDDKKEADDKKPSKDAAPSQTASAPAAPPAAALAPIAPPPPPPDQPPAPPKTIAVGQTKDVVVASWGQPTKVVKLASKEIYFYPDMKVTFVAGKVSDVQ